MALRRVLPDTNVCYPISLLDLLLRLDEVALHEILWTEDLLAELVETWVDHGVRSREAAERLCDDLRGAFAGQDVPRSEYADLIAAMPGDDPDDHLHAAAAVARAPATIVTRDLRDFPAEPLARLGVGVRTPDDYLNELFDEHADTVARVVEQMAAGRRRPPMTVDEVLNALAGAGVPHFARRVRQYRYPERP